jgi:hypothetical protein
LLRHRKVEGTPWRVENGVLYGLNKRTWIISPKEYGDFTLKLETFITRGSNGGICRHHAEYERAVLEQLWHCGARRRVCGHLSCRYYLRVFIVHSEIDQAGASPDGYVGDEGMVEIKCPESKTMIETLLSDKIPDKYFKQMQWQMACTGRKWCDYVVFDPRMPENLQLCVRRVERDDYIIDEIKSEINKFLAELDQQVTKLRAL